MKSPAGWEKRLLITLFITLFLFFITKTTALAFGPEIVDVTTKAFSVVWTTGGSYTSCGINLYTNSNYTTMKTLTPPSQIIVETDPNNPGQYGKQYGIAKVTVVGLDVGTKYYFRVTQNGAELSQDYEVTTERLRGLDSTDPNKSDIVSNDIVHKAVYNSDGTSPGPGIGALVLGTIYDHDGVTVLSDYPVSAWVGDGMIGDESGQYDPNSISYKQYAALNMNNLFEKTTNYPLSLEGDNPATSDVNESEIIEFTIVHGTQSILGGTSDFFTSYGRIESIEKAGNEKITTAKISASFKFNKGITPFAFPFGVPSGYTTGDLIMAIDETVDVQGGIVDSVFLYRNGTWNKTSKNRQGAVVNPLPFQAGQGCFILMKDDMTKEVLFYGKPDSVSLDLMANTINMISIPQLPVYYDTGTFLKDIEGLGGSGLNSIDSIFTFVEGSWAKTFKNPRSGIITGAKTMSNSTFYVVLFKSGANDVTDWDPFP